MIRVYTLIVLHTVRDLVLGRKDEREKREGERNHWRREERKGGEALNSVRMSQGSSEARKLWVLPTQGFQRKF